jgi:ferredoxin-NADP reductase
MDLDHMPALLVAHRRPGFYFRVLQEGEVGSGDPIEKLEEGPERMTVAEIDSLLYSADHPMDALRRAVRISALSPGWQGSMNALLDASLAGRNFGNAGLSPAPTAIALWSGMRPLRIVASTRESEDVRSFELAAEDGSSLPDALPGQHIVVRCRPRLGVAAVMRNYSLCGSPGRGIYRIAVKREPGGIASNYLHEYLKVGDMLQASAPRGIFVLDSGRSPVVLMSAGVGVTPLMAMLRTLAEAGRSLQREIWWVHSARDGAHHAFADEVRGLIAGMHQARSFVFYSRPSAEDRATFNHDAEGRVDAARLRSQGMPLSATFYLCGPTGFMNTVASALREQGVLADHIRTEVFGPAAAPSDAAALPSPHPPDGEPGSGPIVTFVRSGLAVPWDRRFGRLLELAEACDVPVHWSCRSGVCHRCECGIVDGELAYSTDPIDPPREGIGLICCATPRTNLDLDL